jgi:hypothetical protein
MEFSLLLGKFMAGEVKTCWSSIIRKEYLRVPDTSL